MEPLSSPGEISAYYRQRKVAEKYIARRFTDPLNKVEHARQVVILNGILSKVYRERAGQERGPEEKVRQEKKLLSIVELACGPARVTAALETEKLEADNGIRIHGISIDNSREMLKLARKRMKEAGKTWVFLQGDVFKDDLNKKILKGKMKPADLIFTFRFLLHFKMMEREKVYRAVHKALAPGGLFVFEAMNKKVVRPLRKVLGRKRYFVYDQLYERRELAEELQRNGFVLLRLCPVLSHFWLQALLSRPFKAAGTSRNAEKIVAWLENFPSREPYQWVVLCRKQ